MICTTVRRECVYLSADRYQCLLLIQDSKAQIPAILSFDNKSCGGMGEQMTASSRSTAAEQRAGHVLADAIEATTLPTRPERILPPDRRPYPNIRHDLIRKTQAKATGCLSLPATSQQGR